MKHVWVRLQNYYKTQATDIEKPVLSFILNNPRQAAGMDIHTLAAQGCCSAATLVRICQKNGFSGFRTLKQALCEELGYQASLPKHDVSNPADDKSQIEHILYENMKAIQNTYDLLDMRSIEQVVLRMQSAPCLYLFGIGASFLVMKDFSMKCVRISKPVSLYEDLHLQIVVSGNIQPGDLCFVASYSGQTQEMIRIAENIKARQGFLVAITQYSPNRIAALADISLYVPHIEESLRVGASSSRISQLSIVDILFHTYLRRQYETSMDRIQTSQRLLAKEEPEEGSLPSFQTGEDLSSEPILS